MRTRTKANLLAATSIVLGILTVAAGALGLFLIKEGGWPPPGTSSLGHVGMVVAGIIASFIALIAGLFVIYCLSKRKNILRADPDLPPELQK